jgi:SAM-dependent methyltransferase
MAEVQRACPLCGVTRVRVILTLARHSAHGEAYRVVQCCACELCYTDPLPEAGELEALYTHEYYGNQRKTLLGWDSLRLLLHNTVLMYRHQALLGRRPGRILDIGCGDGGFLERLRQQGWEVFGTEFSESAYGLATKRGVKIHRGEVASAGFPDGYFDVVTLWHVLEHLPDPRTDLAEVRRVLRDDGLLVLEVPNIDSPTFRICREHWFPLDIPRHIQHFSPTSIQRLLHRVGFSGISDQHFHHLDFILAFISFMNLLGILGEREGIHYFVTDYRNASGGSKALFLALGIFVGFLSIPYSIGATLLAKNGETFTLVARKTPQWQGERQSCVGSANRGEGNSGM